MSHSLSLIEDTSYVLTEWFCLASGKKRDERTLQFLRSVYEKEDIVCADEGELIH